MGRMILALLRVVRNCAFTLGLFALAGCGVPPPNPSTGVSALHDNSGARGAHAASPGLRRLLQRS
jgi:hypothetical protein